MIINIIKRKIIKKNKKKYIYNERKKLEFQTYNISKIDFIKNIYCIKIGISKTNFFHYRK